MLITPSPLPETRSGGKGETRKQLSFLVNISPKVGHFILFILVYGQNIILPILTIWGMGADKGPIRRWNMEYFTHSTNCNTLTLLAIVHVTKLNVAKYNLGKVNLKAMLVSCFPCYSRGDPITLEGAPCDLHVHTQLFACSSLQSVVAIACCLRAWFFPSLSPS